MPKARARPFVLVLAGVNGAGKSSVGGALLADHGLDWFNPDSVARELMARLGLDQAQANGRAWELGRSLLEAALVHGTSFAFETTLGGTTMASLLVRAARTHDVVMLFCGLSSPEQHLARVQLRVAGGGHPIAEHRIRERWTTSRVNLITLLPQLARLQVFDNSAEAAPGQPVPDPVLLLETKHGRVLFPAAQDASSLEAIPAWARPIVQAALENH